MLQVSPFHRWGSTNLLQTSLSKQMYKPCIHPYGQAVLCYKDSQHPRSTNSNLASSGTSQPWPQALKGHPESRPHYCPFGTCPDILWKAPDCRSFSPGQSPHCHLHSTVTAETVPWIILVLTFPLASEGKKKIQKEVILKGPGKPLRHLRWV